MKTNEIRRRLGAQCLRLIGTVLLSLMILLVILAAREPAYAEEPLDFTRLSGKTRFETSFAIANYLYRAHGRFENMTVASGMNYPDALSGCYLTKVKDTPLLLVDKSVEDQVVQRITMYTKPGGTVYLLGGPGSISAGFEKKVRKAGFEVVRLAQGNRYGTNLEILKEAGTKGQELLVASGENYPDSLSASAVPKPLMLVGNALTPEQRAFLKQAGITKIYILGGEGSVSKAIEKELKRYAPLHRIAGSNRYKTSFLIASYFMPDADRKTIASGQNFPDGLAGGPVAMYLNAPLILVSKENYGYAHYCNWRSSWFFDNAFVFGGRGSVEDITAAYVFGQREDGKMTLERFLKYNENARLELENEFEKAGYRSYVNGNVLYLTAYSERELVLTEEEIAEAQRRMEESMESEQSNLSGFVAELEKATGVRGIILQMQYIYLEADVYLYRGDFIAE